MASISLNLRIGSVFIIWAASAAGVGFPFLVPSDQKESPFFRCLKACTAGVMLGIALMHLLPDADEDLSEIYPEYSLAFALTAFGVILNLVMEQAAMMYLSSRSRKQKQEQEVQGEDEPTRTSPKSSPAREADIPEHGEHCGFVRCEHKQEIELSGTEPKPFAGISSATLVDPKHQLMKVTATQKNGKPRDPELGLPQEDPRDPKSSETEEEDETEQLMAGILQTQDLRELVALYAMELSISVHSIIIGVDIGLLAGGGSLTTLIALICAIAFHQGVEGMGLGTVLRGSRTGSNLAKVAVFVVLFTCSTPVGIIIGICTSSQGDSAYGTAAKGAANSLAAGSLLYISLTEMVASYFASSDLARRPALKSLMIAAFALGIAFMAVIAIWA